jgi:hypothetical protein
LDGCRNGKEKECDRKKRAERTALTWRRWKKERARNDNKMGRPG